AQIMRVMQHSQQSRPKLRRIGDQIAVWYTPLALAISRAAWLFSGMASRFLAVIVIATPCPLILAIPVAVSGAVSAAAKRGIVLKDPKGLEQAGQCRTFIFDKTGTLTYGRPKLTEVISIDGFRRKETLQIASSLEKYSKHPLAEAILNASKAEGISPLEVRNITENPGEGLRAEIGGKHVLITGRKNASKFEGD